MKRLKFAGLLSAALLLFVMSGTAQTNDDVIKAFNNGASAAQIKDWGKVVESFQQVIDLGTKVGKESDSLRKVAQSKIAKFQFNYAYFVVSKDQTSTNAVILAAFQKAKDLADKYGDAAISAQVDGVVPTIYTNIAKAAFKANDFATALTNFDKVISLDPNNLQAYYAKGVIFKSQKQFDPMLQAMTKAIEIATKSGDTTTLKRSKTFLETEYLVLAGESYVKKDFKGTLVPLAEAMKYVTTNPQAYYYLAVSKNGLKEFDAALEAVTNGLKYEKPTNTDLVARFYYEQGVAYAGKGDKVKAVDSFKLITTGKYLAPAAAYIKGLTAKPVPPAPAK